MQHRRNYGKASSLSRVSGGDPDFMDSQDELPESFPRKRGCFLG